MGITEDKKAYILARTYNFCDEKDAKYEPYKIDDDNWVFRLAHRARSNNIMVKFDPNEVV